jgi:hypothetical protein
VTGGREEGKGKSKKAKARRQNALRHSATLPLCHRWRDIAAATPGGEAMKNFESLFAAYVLIWAIFFFYEVSVARRLARLSEDIERLKDSAGRKS